MDSAQLTVENGDLEFLPITSDLSRSKTVLLVEDEAFLREVMGDVLESAGYQVLKARDGKEALALFRSHGLEVQLLVSDVVLPGRNGYELAHELREAASDMKVIMISGYANHADTSRRASLANPIYLPKPFSAEDLLHVVDLALKV